MSEVLITLINRLPVEALLGILAILFVALVLGYRVKRNKAGKFYIYSPSYENAQHKTKQLMAEFKGIKELCYEAMAWTQRIILLDEDFSVGERIAAGSRLEQLSDGWKRTESCYNGEARSAYNKLCGLINSSQINRNEYLKDSTKPMREI